VSVRAQQRQPVAGAKRGRYTQFDTSLAFPLLLIHSLRCGAHHTELSLVSPHFGMGVAKRGHLT